MTKDFKVFRSLKSAFSIKENGYSRIIIIITVSSLYRQMHSNNKHAIYHTINLLKLRADYKYALTHMIHHCIIICMYIFEAKI